MWNLCSGNTWAKPSAFSIAAADLRRLVVLCVAEAARVEDVRAETQSPCRLASDGDLIARDHLDTHAHLTRRCDRRLRLLTRRVEQWQDAE